MQELRILTTVELLEALRRKEGGCSDYRLAKILGMSHQAIHKMLHKGAVMSDETALKVSKEIDIPPAIVVFSIIRERTKSQEIRDILDTIQIDTLKASCLALLGFVVILNPFPGIFA